MFSTLDPNNQDRKRSGCAFFYGALVQSALLSAVAFLSLLFPSQLPLAARRYVTVWMPDLTPPPAPAAVKPPRRIIRPKLDPPKVSETPKIQMVELILPRIRPHATPVSTPPQLLQAAISPSRSSLPPLPPAPAFQESSPAPKAAEQPSVKTGLFGGAHEQVTTTRRLSEVQTGGFGSPEGLPGHAQGGSHGNVPKLGLFGLPDGPGVGNGTGGTHGIQGVVASAGFGSGIAGKGLGHHGNGTGDDTITVGGFGSGEGHGLGGNGRAGYVNTGGFEKVIQPAQPVAKAVQVTTVQFEPLEIISKPLPVYTEEARLSRIQGEVALSVVFLANGSIRVLGVVKPLGYGLDQAALEAALRIRFKPALRDGKPADFPATLRIEFRLADQST
jgi:TonB family protein